MSMPFSESNDELAALFENIGRMLRGKGGSVDWDAARASAVQAIDTDDAITDADNASVAAAAQLAALWLDQVTDLAHLVSQCAAMNRRMWLEATFDGWKVVVEPVADGMAAAMSLLMPEAPRDLSPELLDGLPPEMREQMQAVMRGADFSALSQSVGAIARSMGATMFGVQFGQALADMSAEVLSASDVGIALGVAPTVMPHNVAAFATGLGISRDEAMLYVTLRELAHQRLYSTTPWLSSRILAALTDYARGVRVDTRRIESVLGSIDPANPDSLSQLMGGNLFDPTVTADQRAALDRLELLLALVEGWVTCVVTAAVDRRLATVDQLEESVRRRRATGGPAEKLLGGLVGLEPRPRLIREATTLWQHITQVAGAEARDALWQHPDLMPTAADLAEPTSFQLPGGDDLVAELD